VALFYMDFSSYIDYGVAPVRFFDTTHHVFATYDITSPVNIGAKNKGIELGWQQPVWGPFGAVANYTYTDSTAHFPGHAGDATLPGQSKHVGNVAASYEKAGFTGRVSVNFHGAYLDTVGANNLTDRFYDTNRQLDVVLLQKLTHNTHLYLNLLNLNDALLRYYQGVPDRVQQEEHYHWWAEFGVKVGF